MAKSKETFNKREKEKKRLQQRQEKKERREERKANAQKGKPLNDMLAYIDENGNLSSTPPDPKKKKIFSAEEMVIAPPQLQKQEDGPREGKLTFYNYEKGFGFINDDQSGERIFVHMSQFTEEVKENDKVHFEVEQGERGFVAVNVRKLKA